VDVATLVVSGLGGSDRIAVRAYDGSRAGPVDAAATVVVRDQQALSRVLLRPGELGLARAYVSGELDVEGDLYAALERSAELPALWRDPKWLASLAALVGRALRDRPQPPPEEVRLRGLRHTKRRDASAVSHHYDVSNEFYGLVLGPAMTYSCALFERPGDSLEQAQANKHELICRKLGVGEGTRLLDVGCGWGSLLLHAASKHGVQGVGVTISRQQVELAAKRIADAGLHDRLEIRLQDYRDTDDGPFDAISSVGMFEHVGSARFGQYTNRLFELLKPGGRLLNHAISRPATTVAPPLRAVRTRARRVGTAAGVISTTRIRSPFMQRYVFPDAELLEVGSVVTTLQEGGFEVRHVESLREHYALTLRRWVANLEGSWDHAVSEVGEARARIWRLYMAASALGFERNGISVHQVLAVKPENGHSGLPLRPRF
jgi:cyclopropane-fatty-acyl-phospholipid synthase